MCLVRTVKRPVAYIHFTQIPTARRASTERVALDTDFRLVLPLIVQRLLVGSGAAPAGCQLRPL